MDKLARTSWRGMCISHPADWELTFACGLDGPGRCVFADRYFQRLEICWRELKYVPKLEMILSRHLGRVGGDWKTLPLSETAPEWHGLVRQGPQGTIVHAGKFFPQANWLAEATIVWPEGRDQSLEGRILGSVEAQDPEAPVRLWQAMGLSVALARGFQLHRSSWQVGLIRWNFRTSAKKGPLLCVERVAMPEYWLEGPLRDWLEQQLPPGFRKLRGEMATYNSHRGERLIAVSKAGTLSALRGIRKVRMDLAWQCPAENRLYRISLTDLSREEEVSLPEDLAVRCCQAPAAAEALRAGG